MNQSEQLSKHSTSLSSVVPWTTSLDGLPALAVRQPWAWLIVNGFKDIENRSRRTHHCAPLLIHASLSRDSYAENVQLVKRKHGISVPLEIERGGIVGVVDVIDCVESHKSKCLKVGRRLFMPDLRTLDGRRAAAQQGSHAQYPTEPVLCLYL
jgi:ASCH domain